MVALQTKIRLPEPLPERLYYGQNILSLGSCFSEHIGRHLQALGHSIVINPNGTIYNPIAIAKTLQRLLEGRTYTTEDLYEYDGLWHSSLHHGSYSRAKQEEALALMNQDFELAKHTLSSCRYLLITWGTAWIYRDLAHRGEVVSNCHKRPEKEFERRLYGIDELVQEVLPVLQKLKEISPEIQIISTISPIRHLRDGAHGNQLSKATLLLMDEALRRHLGDSYQYFPSYEILLDELRDYRFYAEDMAHPSELAQRIIREALVEWLLSPEALSLGKEVLKLKAQYEHRSLQPDHPETELRREQLCLLIRSMQMRYPELNLSSWFAD